MQNEKKTSRMINSVIRRILSTFINQEVYTKWKHASESPERKFFFSHKIENLRRT